MKLFVKQFIAEVKGDDAEALGLKVLRQANSGLNTSISNLGGDTIGLEDFLEETKENQNKARLNYGKSILNREDYVSNLLKAKNKVTDAEEALSTHLAKIEFLKSQLAALDEEATSETVI